MSTTPDTPPVDELRRSVETFYRFIDRLGLTAVTEACALMQLDRLVRRYPAAARESLRLLDRDGRAASGRDCRWAGADTAQRGVTAASVRETASANGTPGSVRRPSNNRRPASVTS